MFVLVLPARHKEQQCNLCKQCSTEPWFWRERAMWNQIWRYIAIWGGSSWKYKKWFVLFSVCSYCFECIYSCFKGTLNTVFQTNKDFFYCHWNYLLWEPLLIISIDNSKFEFSAVYSNSWMYYWTCNVISWRWYRSYRVLLLFI